MDECVFEVYSFVVRLHIGQLKSKGRRKLVVEIMIKANAAEVKQRTLFARFGDGRWYAILPEMEAGLRKAGAEVSVMPLVDAEEGIAVSGVGRGRPPISDTLGTC